MSILLKDLDTAIINYCDVEIDYKNILQINKYYNNIIMNDNLFLDLKRIIEMKINMKDKKNLFIYSCRMGFKFFVKYLVLKYKINIHANDENAFRSSCENGHIETVKYLIELANQPNYQQINIHADDEYAFRWSCQNGDIEIAKYLIELGNQAGMIPISNDLIARHYPKN